MTDHVHLFPVFLKLSGRRVLVVGAGQVAASKIGPLLQAGANVRVVAPAVSSAIESMKVEVARRAFRASDLDEAWLVIAAATPDVNQHVASEARTRHVFVNAVDDPANASAYLGGVVRRAGVTFAISTDGRAPALAGLLREGLDAALPEDELDAWVVEAERLRRNWKANDVPMHDRRPQLLKALVERYESRPDEL
jgi:uroporphyrin-III C-methyltransferase/precorrin-2 dehydrogenase/sirohydrochlorin ferrochelatase